jgi:hypothetical protein
MRIEYNFGLESLEVPRFSVEATEGPAKLFTLATLVLNILAARHRADIVFHSPNPDEPTRNITLFEEILGAAPSGPGFKFEVGDSGRLGGVYYQWLSIHSDGEG